MSFVSLPATYAIMKSIKTITSKMRVPKFWQTKWGPYLLSNYHRISILNLTVRMSELDPCIHVSETSLEHHLFNLYIGASIRDQISMIDRFISQSVPFGCNPPASSILGISLPCLHKYSTPLFVRCHADKINLLWLQTFIDVCARRIRRRFISLK